MSTPILATKLYIPSPRPNTVLRPRLLERLDDGLHRKLNLVAAPAGFGKTTLVCEWVTARERPVAWLSLDEGDNDPERFLTYLITALQTVAPNIGDEVLSLLQSPQPPPIESVLTVLLNEITAIPDNLVLVLDDYHVIESQPVDKAILYLLEHLPQQTGDHGGMHLVITSRMDPSFPLSRLRAGGLMTEIREDDLRFTLAETTAFLGKTTGLNLSSEHVAALVAHTEGWVAGLQLAVLSMQGLKRSDGVTDFVNKFTGSDRYIHDYLADEVLQQRPKGTKDFLLQTAILDRLSAPLCDAVTQRKDSQAILETLEAANLFLIPLDDERRWYRYHHLFADLLQQRRRLALPEQTPSLHRRASEWYAQNGFVDEAIEHALRAADFEGAAKQIERVAEVMWASGIDSKLRRWLVELPDELLFAKPQLCVFHAWYLLAGGNQDAAERVIRIAELGLDAGLDGPTELAPQAQEQREESGDSTLRGRLEAIQAFSAFYRGDVPKIIQHARQALEFLPAQDLAWRGAATHLLGDGYDFSGNMIEAHRSRLAGVEASRSSGNSMQIVIVNLKYAIILRRRGQLQQVIEICRQQMDLATESSMAKSAVAGWLLAIWGETLAELNQLDEAIDKANEGVQLTERGGDMAMLGWSYLCLIRTRFATGDLAGAEEIVSRLDNLERNSFVPPWISDLNAAWQARLWLAQSKLETAAQWVETRGLDANREPSYVHEMAYIVFARILIAQGRLNEATDLLQRQIAIAESGGRTSRVIEMLMLKALAFQAGRHRTRALTTLEQCLALAEPGGFTRLFVDEGPPMEALLSMIKPADGKMNQYVRKLLAAFSEKQVHPSLLSPQPLIEPLSQREIEVLQLIAEGLTNQEIAAKLYVSLNTVKVHTRNINGKLGVHNRTKAVVCARALGVLPSV